MIRVFAEWTWRAAVIVVLVWIGWDLHQIRQDMRAPIDDQTTAAAEPDGVEEQLAAMNAKLDAIMVVLPQLKR